MANVSSVASLHVQVFRQVFRGKHRATHDEPGIPGMYRFEVIAPYQFLCTVSSKPEFVGHDATLTPIDQLMYNALKHSTQAIQVCMFDFAPKRGKGVAKAGGEDVELEGEDADD